MALPRMKVQEFTRCGIESDFSYQSPAKTGDDLSMLLRNDLHRETWDAGNGQQLNCHSRVWPAKEDCVEKSSGRVLVVEDSEPFQKFIRSTLRETPQLQIVGEVSDGLEAVRKAEALQPDLIVLDVGLPSLNGIEVARRIRKVSPRSRILFLSQESSADVVQAALGTGARGYVVKTDAGRELEEAVNKVLRGEHFVGARFTGHDFGIHAEASKGAQSRVAGAPLYEHIQIAH
jgi:CheY-like chemotaxis protein